MGWQGPAGPEHGRRGERHNPGPDPRPDLHVGRVIRPVLRVPDRPPAEKRHRAAERVDRDRGEGPQLPGEQRAVGRNCSDLAGQRQRAADERRTGRVTPDHRRLDRRRRVGTGFGHAGPALRVRARENAPPDETVSFQLISRGGGPVRTLNVPNWDSSTDGVTIQWNDFDKLTFERGCGGGHRRGRYSALRRDVYFKALTHEPGSPERCRSTGRLRADSLRMTGR